MHYHNGFSRAFRGGSVDYRHGFPAPVMQPRYAGTTAMGVNRGSNRQLRAGAAREEWMPPGKCRVYATSEQRHALSFLPRMTLWDSSLGGGVGATPDNH